MADDSFGIGFVGAGFITRESHAPSVQYVPDVHVGAILNPTQSRAEDLAATCREEGWGDPSVYGEGEVAAAVADPDVDGLWVTSPNHTRVDAVEAACEAVEDGADLRGIALEKPVARNLAETDRVLEAVESAGLPHAYLENWPHEPDIAKMRDLLWDRGREAGRPYIARSQAEHGGPHSGWFWDGTKQGGGALTDMLCHALAGNEFLLSDPAGGDLEPVSVSADTDSLKWSQPEYAARLREEYGVDYAESPAEDYARATVRYEDADGRPVVSEATGSWCYVGAGVRRQVELLGPEYSGQVTTDNDSKSVFFSDELAGGEGWAEKQNASAGQMPISAGAVFDGGFVAENRDAVEAFRRGENAALDLTDGRRVMEVCMAAYRAAETGEDVDVREADLTSYTPPPARE
ncbi:MAG: Gfo/Idh/MocA family protein [Halobacteriaceae archaeon]